MSTAASPSLAIDVSSAPGRARPWAGPAGAGLLVVASVTLFWFLPDSASAGAAGELRDFYAVGHRYGWAPVVELAALLGCVLMLWFAADLRGLLRRAGGVDPRPTAALLGTVGFAILVPAGLLVQGTPAGELTRSSVLPIDPAAAVLFHHLGYDLMALGMAAAAVAAVATAAVLKDTEVLSRVAYRATLAVAVLALASSIFVYAALLVFGIWVSVLGLRLPRAVAARR